MRKGSDASRKTLSKDYIKRVIDYAVDNWNIQILSFTGGEPFLFLDDIVELINHASSRGVKYIRTGTNGFAFCYDPAQHDKFEKRVYTIAEKLSQTNLRNLWISLDSSCPEVHEEMRGFPGLINGIEKAVPILQEYGIYPAANLGINRNIGGRYGMDEINDFNEEKFYERYSKGFSDFCQRVINLGFTMANTCYPMSMDIDDVSYLATSKDRVVSFTREEKAVLFKALFDTLSEYRPKIRIFTPKTSLCALMKFYNNGSKTEYPCRGGIDFFYMDAETGHLYPCGYRVEDDLGEIWDIDLETLREQKPFCVKCDWECFRDPTELYEPLINLYHHPISALIKIFKNEKSRLWLRDVLYFYSCDFFDGRKPPNYQKMRRFTKMFSSNGTCQLPQVNHSS
ncbi:radical SAM protein [Candidatus Poribacteria bacterium]|nr:radical SAM protein [Candidatus Poribacteria bacterium]